MAPFDLSGIKAASTGLTLAELRAALGEPPNETGVEDELDIGLDRTLQTVSARIESYAPCAPQAVKNEAMVRAVAWLRDTRGATRVSKVSVVDIEPAPVHSGGWFRQSGAMSLLSAWRTRGAFTVEETSA